MQGRAGRVAAQGFLEDFLGLQVAAVGQVDIGLGQRVDIAARVELARRIGRGQGGGGILLGVDVLAAAGAEERIRRQLAFQEAAVARRGAAAALHGTVGDQRHQQGHQQAGDAQHTRVAEQPAQEAFFLCRRGGRSRWGGGFGWGGSGDGRNCRCRSRGRRGGCRGCGRGGHRCGGRGRRGYGRRGGHRCRWLAGGAADAVQFVEVARQLGHAGRVVAGLVGLGDALGLGRAAHGALGQGEPVGGAGGRLAVFHLGLHAAAGAALRRAGFHGRRAARQAAAEFIEVAALGHDDLACLGRRRGGCARSIGHRQHRARTDAVDVAADEGIGVGLQQGHQHLVERDAGRLGGAGDAAGGVARAHGDLLLLGRRRRTCRCWRGDGCGDGRRARRRCRAWCGNRSGKGGRHRLRHGTHRARGDRYRRRRGRGQYRKTRRRCRRRRRGLEAGHRGGGRRRQLRGDGGRAAGLAAGRGVEQQGVVARQAAAGRIGLQQHFQERFVDRAAAGQPDHGPAVAAAFDRHLHAHQGRVVFDAGRTESRRRTGLHREGFGLPGRQVGHLDLGAQGLAQVGRYRHAPHHHRHGIARGQASQRQDGCGHRVQCSRCAAQAAVAGGHHSLSGPAGRPNFFWHVADCFKSPNTGQSTIASMVFAYKASPAAATGHRYICGTNARPVPRVVVQPQRSAGRPVPVTPPAGYAACGAAARPHPTAAGRR